MIGVTQAIRLASYTLDNLAPLGKLRAQCMSARAQVCVERARYITEYLRDLAAADEPAEIRRAKDLRRDRQTAFWPPSWK